MPRKKKEESSPAKPKAKSKAKAPAKAKAPKKTTTAKAVKKVAPKTKTHQLKTVTARRQTAPSIDVESLSPAQAKKVGFNKAEPFLVATSAFKPLPRHGENQLVAFVRDPQCVFTYWEITPEKLEEVKRELQDEFKGSFMILRLYEVNSHGDRILVKEIRVEPEQINHYVNIDAQGGTYVFEIARKTPSGRVVAYVSSRPVATGAIALDGADPTGSPLDASDPLMVQGMDAYYAEQGYEDPSSYTGNSSAQNALRKHKAYWSSSH